MTMKEIIGLMVDRQRQHPEERSGQAAFNACAFSGVPELEAFAEDVRSTDADPFYHEPGDGRLAMFMWALTERFDNG